MLVPTFFSVRSEEKKCPQKIFDTTHSLGCGPPLVILFGAKVQFSRHYLQFQAKLQVLDKNVVELSLIIFARSTTLQNKFLMQDQQFGQKFQIVIFKTVAKCRKVSLTGAYSPKYGFIQKNFVCTFFPYTLLKKSQDKHFFIRAIFWDLLVLS